MINEVIKNVYKRLNFQSISDFANYLNTFGLSLNEVKNKLKIEIMWNQLIAEKFKNKILIDEDKIRKKIQKEKINYKNLIQYDLSEIVFTAKNTQELISKKEKIKSIIDDIGFETAANKFSISETANFGGNIGKVNENQLSLIIKDQLKDIEIRVGKLHDYLKIDQKNIELQEDELKTQDPNFWNDPKEAEKLMKIIRNKKEYIFNKFIFLIFNILVFS